MKFRIYYEPHPPTGLSWVLEAPPGVLLEFHAYTTTGVRLQTFADCLELLDRALAQLRDAWMTAAPLGRSPH
jgi:hypothetical protein